MRKTGSGFTIVELLVVIVVIAILAAITIVAYNGIQTRAKNSKTISATNAWIKAVKLYQADNGSYPPVNSCLGTLTTYPDNGRCWTSSSWVVSSSFLSTMQPYISSYPEPDTTNVDSTADKRRGAFFNYSNPSTAYIYMMLSGTSTCPDMSISHYNGGASDGVRDGGINCIYQF
jgi:prepilin-type N-terminal cleavage/methylation domain-containing protein